MKPDIGISEKHLDKSTHILTVILSDEMALYVKTRKFHWNVTGESFMELHQLFQTQYTFLEKTIDKIAERINKLGENTIGTMHEFAQNTRLKEHPDVYPGQKEMLKDLLNDHELLCKELRTDIKKSEEEGKDVVTIDFLVGILEQHESTAWVLRRYLN